MRVRSPTVTGLAVVTVLTACRDPTQITLEISTDVACDIGVDTSIAVGVLSEIEEKPPTATTARCDPATGRIGSLVAIPADEGETAVAFRVVSGVDGTGADQCLAPSYGPDCIVARRVLTYIENKKLLLPVVMRDACRGVPCDANRTCVNGVCVSAEVDPNTCTDADGCGEEELGGGEGGQGGAGGGGGAGGIGGAGGGGGGDPLDLEHGFSAVFGSGTMDIGRTVAVASTGDVYLAGTIITGQGLVDFGGGPIGSGNIDYFLASFTAAGGHRWSLGYETSGSTGDHALAVDASDNLFVVGSLRGATNIGGAPLGIAGVNQPYVASFRNDGSLRWAGVYAGSTEINRATDVATDAQGNVYIVGETHIPVDFGGGTPVCSVGTCMFLLVVSNGGNHIRSQSFGTNAGALGVAVDDASNVYIVGYAYTAVDFGDGAKAQSGSGDVVVASFDDAGNHRWDARFGSSQFDMATKVVVDGMGNVTVGGRAAGPIDFGGGVVNAGSGGDMFLLGLDASGAHRYSHSRYFDPTGPDSVSGLEVSPSGNVFVSLERDLLDPDTGDVAVVSIDVSGEQRWVANFVSTDNGDSAHDLALGGSGELWVTGGVTGPVDFGGGPLATDNRDLFLLRLDPR